MTGGKYYDVRRATDLEQALTDINEVEKGVFYTLSLTRSEPAYFIFVALSLICLALRIALHAVPQFVEDQLKRAVFGDTAGQLGREGSRICPVRRQSTRRCA